MDSDRCLTYGMTTTALGVSSSGGGVEWGVGCQFFFTSADGGSQSLDTGLSGSSF